MESGNELYSKDNNVKKRKFQDRIRGNVEKWLEGQTGKGSFMKHEDMTTNNRRNENANAKRDNLRFKSPQTTNLIQGRPLPRLVGRNI